MTSLPAADPAVIAALLRAGLARGERPRLTVTSGSMSPLLQIGDQVDLQNRPLEELMPGDIVVLALPDALLTHRLLTLSLPPGNPAGLVTQGDRLPAADPRQPLERYLGLVCGRWRSGRYLDLRRGNGGQLSQKLWRLTIRRNQISDKIPLPLHRPLRAVFLTYASLLSAAAGSRN